MFSDFAQEKETFVTIKNRNFQSPKKSHFFLGVNLCFWPKNANMPTFPLFTFGQNKTRNIADFAEKKETSLTIKKHN